MPLLLLRLLLPVLLAAVRAASDDPFLSGTQANHNYNIDCGGPTNFTSAFSRHWLADRYFSTGDNASMVAEPHRILQPLSEGTVKVKRRTHVL